MGTLAAMEETLGEVCGHLNAQHARLVDLTVWLLANEAEWSGPGVWRPEQYLAWKTGLSPARARQIVAIARRVEELPTCVAAFGRGELAVDQMAAIAQRAPWWTDTEICRLGAAMTVAQLRRTLAGYAFPDIAHPDTRTVDDPITATAPDDLAAVDQNPAEATPVPEPAAGADPILGCSDPVDRCQFHFDDAGRFHLHLTTDKLTGDVIEQALVEARDRLFVDGHRDLTWTDAARAVCQRSLDAISDPGRRNRYRLNYHLDHTGRVTDPHGWCLPDAIARHLTCDGLWTPTFTNGATPVSVGRSDRIVPDRTRRLVEHRDQGCRVPGCTQTRWLDVHHIIHWLDLGPTDTWNLICLCPHHHRLHHQAKLGITGNADHPHGVVFTNLAGNPIAQTGAKPTPPTGAPPPPIGTYHHPLGERLDTHWLHFNPPPQHHTTTTTPHAAPPPGGDS